MSVLRSFAHFDFGALVHRDGDESRDSGVVNPNYIDLSGVFEVVIQCDFVRQSLSGYCQSASCCERK